MATATQICGKMRVKCAKLRIAGGGRVTLDNLTQRLAVALYLGWLGAALPGSHVPASSAAGFVQPAAGHGIAVIRLLLRATRILPE
jgi:hypothetical protein